MVTRGAVSALPGWVRVVWSVVRIAIVFSSALTARRLVCTLVARATGSSARTPMTALSCSRSGPTGNCSILAGQRGRPSAAPILSSATSSPSLAVSTSSDVPRAAVYSRLRPARNKRQSKVSSQVRRSVLARPVTTTLKRESEIFGKPSPCARASSGRASTNSETSRTAFSNSSTSQFRALRVFPAGLVSLLPDRPGDVRCAFARRVRQLFRQRPRFLCYCAEPPEEERSPSRSPTAETRTQSA